MKNTSLGSIVNSALPWMVSERSSVNVKKSFMTNITLPETIVLAARLGGWHNRWTWLTIQVTTILKSDLLVVSLQLGTQSTYAKSLTEIQPCVEMKPCLDERLKMSRPFVITSSSLNKNIALAYFVKVLAKFSKWTFKISKSLINFPLKMMKCQFWMSPFLTKLLISHNHVREYIMEESNIKNLKMMRWKLCFSPTLTTFLSDKGLIKHNVCTEFSWWRW